MLGVAQKMLDFDRHIVSELRERLMQGVDEGYGMANAIKKIRIAKGDMLGPSFNLLPNICQDNVGLNNAKSAFIYRHDRAVPTHVLATPTRFRIAHDALFLGCGNQMGVAR